MDQATTQRLKELNPTWNKTEAAEGFVAVGDGEYVACLKEAKLGVSAKSRRLQVIFVWNIRDGEEKDKDVWDFNGIETEQNMAFFKRKYVELMGGNDITDLRLIEQELEGFVADHGHELFNIKVTTNKEGFKNVAVLGLSEFVEDDMDETVTGEEADTVATDEMEYETEETVEEEQEIVEEEPAPLRRETKPMAKPKPAVKPAAKPATKSSATTTEKRPLTTAKSTATKRR